MTKEKTIMEAYLRYAYDNPRSSGHGMMQRFALMQCTNPDTETLKNWLEKNNSRALTLKYEALQLVPTAIEATMSPKQLYMANSQLWVKGLTGHQVHLVLFAEEALQNRKLIQFRENVYDKIMDKTLTNEADIGGHIAKLDHYIMMQKLEEIVDRRRKNRKEKVDDNQN